jgi:hypothetical protein
MTPPEAARQGASHGNRSGCFGTDRDVMRTPSAALSICLLALACTPAPKEPVAAVAAAEPSSPPKVEPKIERTTPPPVVTTKPAEPTPPAEVAPAVVAEPVESIGGIALGMPLGDLAKQIPGGKSELPPLEGIGESKFFGGHEPPPADERWLWGYDTPGLAVIVAGPTDKGPWRVVHLTANGRSKHTTKKGIGVRSTIAQVRTAYPSAVFDREDSAIIALSETEQIEILFDGGRATHVVLASPQAD